MLYVKIYKGDFMEQVFFKIAMIFKEVEEKHNLMSMPLFEEKDEEVENEVLNSIIKLLIQGVPNISFKFQIHLQIENIKFNKKLSIEDINKLVLIKDCLDIIVNYNIEEFSTLAYSILKDTDKDEFSIIIGHNTNFTLD